MNTLGARPSGSLQRSAMSKEPGKWCTVLDLWRAQREGSAGLAQRQKTRLTALVAHARKLSRFYQRLYRELPAEGFVLSDLPPVTKVELMASFDDWVTDPRVTLAGVEAFAADSTLIATPYCGDFFVCTSAGTTGHPGLFVYDRRAVDTYRAISVGRITPTWTGVRGLLRLARHGFRWAAVVGTGGHYAGAMWMELERRRSRWLSHAYRVFTVRQPLAELVTALNAFNPAILTVYPSTLELLAEEQLAGRLHLRPVFVEIAGESTTHDASARAAAAFGCPIRNVYAASEFLVMAFSCPQDWLHVNSDWAVLEAVDEDLRPTPRGELSHTVLLTNLANRVQPIIRYDLGDSVLVRADTCPCGSPLPAIRVVGRRDDILRLIGPDGTIVKIVPLAISSVVDATPGVFRSQLLQTGPSTIRVRLERRPGVDEEKLWRDVAANLGSYLAQQRVANVAIVRASEPPAQSARFGKFRQVIAIPQAST